MFLWGGGGYRTTLARYVAKWGIIAETCLVQIKVPRRVTAPFWETANLPEKVSRDTGYRSDSIALSRNMGPLRCWAGNLVFKVISKK